ncbi:MAG: YihY/virulence factor BrkB family protein [Gemmatimonadales bacterium]|nr:MAG: YihY/virulence factor BrkB family protein [Gemmatimonadales bacterium]
MSESLRVRVEQAAVESRIRIGGISLPHLGLRVIDRFLEVRGMGLAAEMTYYAILSIFPIIGIVGTGLGFLERFVGPEEAAAAERTILAGIERVFATEVTQDVFVPMIQGLIQEERTAFALGSLLITLFLASRIFRSTINTLEVAYQVEDGRGMAAVWGLGFLFSLGALLTGTLVLALIVVGPLLGGAHAVAAWLGLSEAFRLTWTLLEWPTVLLICIGFLTALYRLGPDVPNRWRDAVPGAILGVVGIIAVSLGFRSYLGIVGDTAPALTEAEALVSLSAQVIGAGLASLLWIWLSCMVIILGGVLNAEISSLRKAAT